MIPFNFAQHTLVIAALFVGGLLSFAVLGFALLNTGYSALPNAVDVAQIFLAVAAVYGFTWLDNEWRSFDAKIQQENGSYYPIVAESEESENVFLTMTLCATYPIAQHHTDDESQEKEVEPVGPMSRRTSLSSTSGGNGSNLWQMVLASGTPFTQVSRRSFVLES